MQRKRILAGNRRAEMLIDKDWVYRGAKSAGEGLDTRNSLERLKCLMDKGSEMAHSFAAGSVFGTYRVVRVFGGYADGVVVGVNCRAAVGSAQFGIHNSEQARRH